MSTIEPSERGLQRGQGLSSQLPSHGRPNMPPGPNALGAHGLRAASQVQRLGGGRDTGSMPGTPERSGDGTGFSWDLTLRRGQRAELALGRKGPPAEELEVGSRAGRGEYG